MNNRHIAVVRQLLLTLVLLSCASALAQTESPSATGQYTCPMHPHYIATDPDGICPICGMDLVPVKDASAADAALGDGITVAPEMIQSLGVRTAPATIRTIERSLRVFGVVEANERLQSAAVSRIEGWIADLSVRSEGDVVAPDALLFRVYSPDLIAAQKELLAAMGSDNASREGPVRQRLRALGMQQAVIERVAREGQVIEQVPVYAETGGTVVSLSIREGDYIKPGTPILRLQSYAEVWVMASVPETELPLVETGLPVQLHFPSAPAAPSSGTIDYVYPTIDATTRTAQVRIVVDNQSGALRPGAYADIVINLAAPRGLAIPTEAILRDSRGAHVVVAQGEGRFSVRELRLGARGNGLTTVVAGLRPGERVVVSGQFLLDSEVNLREGFAKLDPSPSPLGPDAPLSEMADNEEVLAVLDHAVDMALYFHEALTDRYAIDPTFVAPARAALASLQPRYQNTRLSPVLETAERSLREASTAREGQALAAALANLVSALSPWLQEGAPAHYRALDLSFYQMEATGQAWLQQGGDPISPYGDGAVRRLSWDAPDHSGHSAASGAHRPHSSVQ